MLIPTNRLFKPWLLPDFIFKKTNLFSEFEEIKRKIFEEDLRVTYEDLYKWKARPEVMSFFDCMTQYKIEYHRFREMCISFIGASVDTTSSTLVNTLLLLAMHPDIQQRLYDEVSSVISSSNDRVTEAEAAQMPYLEKVIKEVLRLLPIGPILFRKTTAPLKLKKCTAPADSVLHIKTYEIQRDVKIWGEDANEFNPDRFDYENFKKIHPYAYFPFSNGPRICPGYKYAYLSMKIFISRMIMEHRVKTDIKYEDIGLYLTLIMKIKNVPILTFERRSKADS